MEVEVITVKELAALRGVSDSCVRGWSTQGKLPAPIRFNKEAGVNEYDRAACLTALENIPANPKRGGYRPRRAPSTKVDGVVASGDDADLRAMQLMHEMALITFQADELTRRVHALNERINGGRK